MSAAVAIPAVQKAWVNVRQGKPSEAVVFRDDYPVPSKLPPGEVLIKIQAAAYNPVCVPWCFPLVEPALTAAPFSRAHKMMGMLPNFIAKRPQVVEHDFAGVVADANGTDFHNGQEVWGWMPLREYVNIR
jgi:NADPH:quinone reductase-like Zn-dependent oxidoreductase